jgi:hypothetical protein
VHRDSVSIANDGSCHYRDATSIHSVTVHGLNGNASRFVIVGSWCEGISRVSDGPVEIIGDINNYRNRTCNVHSGIRTLYKNRD